MLKIYILIIILYLFGYTELGGNYFQKDFFINQYQHSYAQAIKDCNYAININPKDAKAYYNLGLVYGMEGKLNQAIFSFTKAIEINPEYVEAYHARAFAFSEQVNYLQSFIDYTKVIIISPYKSFLNFIKAIVRILFYERSLLLIILIVSICYVYYLRKGKYLLRGRKAFQQNNLSQAISDFTKVIKSNPKDPSAYIPFFYRGLAYFKQGNFIQAIYDYTNAIEINPGNAETYTNRSFAYLKEKEYDKAWADIHKAKILGYKPNKEDLVFIEELKKASGKDH